MFGARSLNAPVRRSLTSELVGDPEPDVLGREIYGVSVEWGGEGICPVAIVGIAILSPSGNVVRQRIFDASTSCPTYIGFAKGLGSEREPSQRMVVASKCDAARYIWKKTSQTVA